MKKLIILDRDGVINYDSPNYIKSPEEWNPIPGSLEAIARLKQAGYTIIIASNQSGLARKLYDVATLNSIHHKMQHLCQLAGGSIDKIYYCPHHPEENCDCRKPKPGMLLQIAKDFSCSLQNVIMIGDRLSDITAAQAVNAIPIFVATSYIALSPEGKNKLKNIRCFDNLLQAVDAILKDDYQLCQTPSGLELQTANKKISGLKVDFISGTAQHRRLYGGGSSQLIARACGVKKSKTLSILDVTAGLGRDAFALACLGCDVTMIERSPLIAALLEDGLNRLNAHPDLANKVKLQLIKQDAIDYLNNLDEENYPDVIYIDPMHPPRQKSALVKKEMRIIRDIVGSDEDADTLFSIALRKAKKRVVVKRPRLAPTLNNKKPSIVYEGKSTRFDVYLI